MAPEVIKNINIKLVHRLTSSDDRELIGNTMSATSMQIEAMATLTQGGAFMNYEGLLRPFQMQVHYTKEHDVPPPSNIELFDIIENRPALEKELIPLEEKINNFIVKLDDFYENQFKNYVYDGEHIDIKIEIVRDRLLSFLDYSLVLSDELIRLIAYKVENKENIERLDYKLREIISRINQYMDENQVKIAKGIKEFRERNEGNL